MRRHSNIAVMLLVFALKQMYIISYIYIRYINTDDPYKYPNGSKIHVLPLLEFCIFPVPSHGCNVASCDRPRVVDRCDAISRHPTPRRKQEHLEVLALLQDHTWDLIVFFWKSISTQVPKKQLLKVRKRPEVVRFVSTQETWWCWKMSPKIMDQWGQSTHQMICGVPGATPKQKNALTPRKNLSLNVILAKRKQWPISENFPIEARMIRIITKRLKSSSGPRHSKQKSCKITNCWLVGLLSERTLGRCTPFKDHWHKARKKSAWRTPWDWRKNNVLKGSTNWSTSWRSPMGLSRWRHAGGFMAKG